MKNLRKTLTVLLLISTASILQAQTGDLSGDPAETTAVNSPAASTADDAGTVLTVKEENKPQIFAPFASRIQVEAKGSSLLISWKDSSHLSSPLYHIYASLTPFDPSSFIYENKIASVQQGVEHFLYRPGDARPRYYLILVEDEGKIFDIFVSYRNMTMQPVAAVETVVQEEKAARIANLKVYPEGQALIITADSTDLSRPHILFRSNEELIDRDDLNGATQVRTFQSEPIELKDQVVPGIPFYYALVDKALYESGSTIVLYDGSVTVKPVSIAMEEWAPETAHTFKFASRHVPLPLLNVDMDIETGRTLPDPGIPRSKVDLSVDTELALAELNFGKSVNISLWKQPELLPVDEVQDAPPESAWVKELMQDGNWSELLSRCETQLKNSYDSEIRGRLFFYKGQAHYYLGNLEYAFMDFLSSRTKYYSQSNSWLFSIYEQRRRTSVSENLQ
ncbi:MAG: hypothetical protein PQJ58_21345 [Spirochaetales bacterium]|nr:hypothetical protein [Spirochaetales bacterium]